MIISLHSPAISFYYSVTVCNFAGVMKSKVYLVSQSWPWPKLKINIVVEIFCVARHFQKVFTASQHFTVVSWLLIYGSFLIHGHVYIN